MTFRDFIERSLADFEEHLRHEEPEERNIDMRLRGARQFALLLLGEHQKGDVTTRRSPGDATSRRFGGPRN